MSETVVGSAWRCFAVACTLLACGGRGETSQRQASVSETAVRGTDTAELSGVHASPAPATRRTRVLIIGTSLTAGLGLDPDEAYPAILQYKADSAGFAAEIVNAGLSGETSAGALRRTEWLLSDVPDVVIIETGANDGLRGLNPDSTAANIRAIVTRIRARAPDARILVAQMEAPPNLGPAYTKRFHDIFGEVARETGTTLMPFLLEGVAGRPALNQADGIHPTVEGALHVAENVWPSLAPLLRN